MVELIDYDLAAHPPRVTLASDNKWETLEKGKLNGRPMLDLDRVCVLDRASVDFTTRRVVATLRALAGGAGEADFVMGMLGGAVPDGWLRPLDADAGWAETVAAAQPKRPRSAGPERGAGGGVARARSTAPSPWSGGRRGRERRTCWRGSSSAWPRRRGAKGGRCASW